MKVSEMIKNLQKFMDEHGDLDCWYAVDDEGNGYAEVHYIPSLYYANDDGYEVYHLNNVEDMEPEEKAYYHTICVIN